MQHLAALISNLTTNIKKPVVTAFRVTQITLLIGKSKQSFRLQLIHKLIIPISLSMSRFLPRFSHFYNIQFQILTGMLFLTVVSVWTLLAVLSVILPFNAWTPQMKIYTVMNGSKTLYHVLVSCFEFSKFES